MRKVFKKGLSMLSNDRTDDGFDHGAVVNKTTKERRTGGNVLQAVTRAIYLNDEKE